MDLQQHVLVVPCPAQGHVKPLIKMAYNLAYHGIKVTFANTEHVGGKILAAMSESDKEQCPIRLVTYSDGLESSPEKRDGPGMMDDLKKVMPDNLEKLIKQINDSDNEPITCVIADLSVGYILEVARKLGLKQVAVWPAGPGSLALSLHVPKLIETGIIDENGSPIGNELIRLSEEVPALKSSELTWSCPGNPTVQKMLLDYSLDVKQAAENASIVLCNTYYNLDSSSCAMIPNVLPIGPLPAIKKLNPSSGTLSSQDSTCISWLDKQPANSVIYIAFGSTTVFSQKQFNELALVGLSLEHDEDGMISRHEIKTKIYDLLTDDGVKTNALKLMENAKKSVNEGGSSYENFKSFIKYLEA
ncbi:hypothetical protein ACET3Z_027194 [Daucus carota]